MHSHVNSSKMRAVFTFFIKDIINKNYNPNSCASIKLIQKVTMYGARISGWYVPLAICVQNKHALHSMHVIVKPSAHKRN